MKSCPHCGHCGSKQNGYEKKDPDFRRYRQCDSCGERFTTIEVVVVSTKDGYVPFANEATPRPPGTGFRRVAVPPDTWGLPYQLAMDISHWWEVSRWSKHRNKAVWTERAFKGSLERVRQLHRTAPDRARRLVQQGVELGWQTLDPSYLTSDRSGSGRPAAPAPASPTGPISPTMQAAVEKWNAKN